MSEQQSDFAALADAIMNNKLEPQPRRSVARSAPDILVNTMDQQTTPTARLKAIKVYVEAAAEDFPELKIFADNVLILAGFEVNK